MPQKDGIEVLKDFTENGFPCKVIILSSYDDGKGFKTQKLKEVEGFGLNRIRARIKKYKGNLAIISKANEGTSIKIKIPLPH